MSTPYWTYRKSTPVQATNDSRVEVARVNQEKAQYETDARAYTNIERELARMKISARKETANVRKNQLSTLQKMNQAYLKAMADLQNATVDNYDAQIGGAARMFDTMAEAAQNLAKARYHIPEELGQRVKQGLLSGPEAGVKALASSVNEAQEMDRDQYIAGTVDMLLKAIDPKLSVGSSSREEIDAAAAAVGVERDVREILDGLVVDAKTDVSLNENVVSQTQAMANRVAGLVGKGYKNDAELRADIEPLIADISRSRGQIDTTLTASADEIRAALVDDEATFAYHRKLEQRADELYERAFGQTRAEDPNVLVGRVLANDEFRLWARDNGLADIGYANYDSDGNIVGATPGRDLAWAWKRFNYQTQNPAKWGQTFKRKGGQFTDDFVEVRYIPPETPVVGVDGQGRNVLRMNGRLFVMEGGGLREVDVDAAESIRDWDIAYKEEDGRPVPLSLEDIEAGGANVMVVNDDDPKDIKEQVFDVYAKTERGWREKMHAAQIAKYGERGYTTIARESDGERIEFDGALPLQVNVISTGMDSASERSNQRGALRQRLKGGTEEQLAADAKPMFAFGNVQYNRGAATPDPAMNALKDRVIASNASIPDLSLDVPDVPDLTAPTPSPKIKAEVQARTKQAEADYDAVDPETPSIATPPPADEMPADFNLTGQAVPSPELVAVDEEPPADFNLTGTATATQPSESDRTSEVMDTNRYLSGQSPGEREAKKAEIAERIQKRLAEKQAKRELGGNQI